MILRLLLTSGNHSLSMSKLWVLAQHLKEKKVSRFGNSPCLTITVTGIRFHFLVHLSFYF